MSFLRDLGRTTRRLQDRAEQLAGEHGDKIDRGIDQAARLANLRTGGRHRGKITGGASKAKQAVRKFAENGERPDAPPEHPPET
ncbi:antitoxin [soil metagenome]